MPNLFEASASARLLLEELDTERRIAYQYTVTRAAGFVGVLPSPALREVGFQALVGNLHEPYSVNTLHLIPSSIKLVGRQLVMVYGRMALWCRLTTDMRVSVQMDKTEICNLPIAGGLQVIADNGADQLTIFTHPCLATIQHMMRVHPMGGEVLIRESLSIMYPLPNE
ncbi:MAG: hypothetical protein HQ488_02925 [Parcubacteria group bacterium]|nr:hypothetical protein [Parcubacteria group bacterium]